MVNSTYQVVAQSSQRRDLVVKAEVYAEAATEYWVTWPPARSSSTATPVRTATTRSRSTARTRHSPRRRSAPNRCPSPRCSQRPERRPSGSSPPGGGPFSPPRPPSPFLPLRTAPPPPNCAAPVPWGAAPSDLRRPLPLGRRPRPLFPELRSKLSRCRRSRCETRPHGELRSGLAHRCEACDIVRQTGPDSAPHRPDPVLHWWHSTPCSRGEPREREARPEPLRFAHRPLARTRRRRARRARGPRRRGRRGWGSRWVTSSMGTGRSC